MNQAPEPEVENWLAVRDAVHQRRRELKMTTAHLARESGLSETTIRYIGTTARSKAGLVAMSAVLRWRYDHLTNILHGNPQKNVHARPPPLANLERLIRDETAQLRQQINSLTETVNAISRQLKRQAAHRAGLGPGACKRRPPAAREASRRETERATAQTHRPRTGPRAGGPARPRKAGDCPISVGPVAGLRPFEQMRGHLLVAAQRGSTVRRTLPKAEAKDWFPGV